MTTLPPEKGSGAPMTPTDMALPCPKCGMLHIDAPEPAKCPDGYETATDTFDPAGYDPEDCAGCGRPKSEHVFVQPTTCRRTEWRR